MDIYQLTDDFAYKTFTIIGEKVEYITLNGQPLIGSWKEKQGEVYKNYDNKGKKDGFDARICGGLFVMEKEKALDEFFVLFNTFYKEKYETSLW